ncbi:membrane protein [Streptomyces viridiviolaceus]|uniref:MMPL family transporter n=1 Tax=Streptomyces viridiviolaceus TaxID=68282 RepID=A0ABW2E7P0_9ACTN|nr:MMPL family transporter [Streptomyces viridiviolaceus]GHB57186.1 membrane protein [Streptomyces viridiviolaceus]
MESEGALGADRPVLYRWGTWCARHGWRVVAAWVIVLVGAGLLLPKFTDSLTGSSLKVEGSDSARVEALLTDEFDTPVTEDALVVFDSATLRSDSDAYRQAVTSILGTLQKQDGVVEVENPYTAQDSSLYSSDRRTVVAPVGLGGGERDRQDAVPLLQETLHDVTADSPVQAYLTGSSALNAAVVEQQDKDIAQAESIGLPIALVVLLLAFGTLVAAGLPLVLGMVAVLTTFGVLGALSGLIGFDVFVQAVVTMLGLALGIDYCLFAVTRQREELAARGGDVEASVGATMSTAGKAVLFSGCTVLISVAGLMVVRAPVFRTMALGVMIAVAVMLLVGLSLLPAVLGLLGTRINRLAVPGLKRSLARVDTSRSLWTRWTGVVMRRPVLIGGLTSVALLLAIVPVSQLKLGFDVGASAVSDAPAGKGYELVDEKFVPGAATPLQIVVHTPEGRLGDRELDALQQFSDRLRDHRQVSDVVSLSDALRGQGGQADAATLEAALGADRDGALERLVSPDARTTAMLVMSRSAADSEESVALVHWIRDTAAPETVGEVPGLSAYVGGLSGQTVDIAEEVERATPLVLLLVLGLSFILLLLAFRSVVLPLSAIVMNLLSVGAAFGLLTLVFQEGMGASLFDVSSTGFIQAYLPLLTFVILFGLSMDYEVFLISRMKEEWGRTQDNSRAVTEGVAHTAKVITAAAAIMVVIFAAFMLTKVVEVKQMGFALAVAVLLDATLIRVVLVPALMRLLGRHNWWMPAWLDRSLPRFELTEGTPGDTPAASSQGAADGRESPVSRSQESAVRR